MEYEIPLFLRPKAKNSRTLYYDWLKIAQSESGSQIITHFRKATFNEYIAIVAVDLPVAKQGNQW